MLTAQLFLSTLLALSVWAAPVSDASADVSGPHILLDYNPAITSPHGGEVFKSGQEITISWDQTIPDGVDPAQLNQTAYFIMGYHEPGDGPLHLVWTLAGNVPLYKPAPGTITVTLPSHLPFRTTYVISLIGLSGDQSGQFTIIPNLLEPALDENETRGETNEKPTRRNVRLD